MRPTYSGRGYGSDYGCGGGLGAALLMVVLGGWMFTILGEAIWRNRGGIILGLIAGTVCLLVQFFLYPALRTAFRRIRAYLAHSRANWMSPHSRAMDGLNLALLCVVVLLLVQFLYLGLQAAFRQIRAHLGL